MRRPAATTLLLLSIAGTQPGFAAAPGLVCRQPSVLDEMAREVHARNYYTTIDPRLVTEQPTSNPLLVRCQVCVQATPFDTTRFGERPVEQCLAHDFEIRIVPTGFVVRDLR